MSSQAISPESPRFETSEIFGKRQLAMLETLATYDETNPSHDTRTAVGAKYVLEQQHTLGLNLLPSDEQRLPTYDAYQTVLNNRSREGQLASLLEERIKQRSSLSADQNDFDNLMAAYAAAGVVDDLRHRHMETVELQVFETVARMGSSLSESQVQWEINHGTCDATAQSDIRILEAQGEKLVDAGLRATQKAFSKHSEQVMTPAELAEAMRHPSESVGAMISELVTMGALRRNAAENTLSLDQRFQSLGLRGLFARLAHRTNR